MDKIVPLTYGKFYHIYNRGIDSCDIFKENENYLYFLSLYEKHMLSVFETFAWVLMPNHFHFLVKVKEEVELENLTGLKPPHQHLSNMFNAYTKAFNKRFNRHGALFERPFKRKIISNEAYLKQIVIYIHNNPVHHGFCDLPTEYPWSSYQTCISLKPTKLYRENVLGWFDDEANFKFMHNQTIDVEKTDKWLDI
jgi:REP element-mobilizing transposase RayT